MSGFPHESVHPNKYNPNKMTWQDRQLLRTSLLEDGWTQPIVTLPDHTIVDGEQRWTTAGVTTTPADVQAAIDHELKRQAQGQPISESVLHRLYESKSRLVAAIADGKPACIASITGGLVPITVLDLGDDAHKMISTIRHNRARGTHQIDAMASITQDLMALGLDLDDLETRLGMDEEEINRFMKSAEGQLASLQDELNATTYSPAIAVSHISNLGPEAQRIYDASAAANEAVKAHQLELAARQRAVDAQAQAEIARQEAGGHSLTQDQKAAILAKAAAAVPEPAGPARVEMKRILLFMLPDEYDLVLSVLGEQMAVGLVRLCREEVLRRLPSSATPPANGNGNGHVPESDHV